MSLKNFKPDLSFTKNFYVAFCIVSCLCIFANNFALADAADGGAIGSVLCNIVAAINGTVGKGIATIGIVALGVGLFAGKLNWPLAIATAIGIGLIFGAAQMVDFISPSDTGEMACPK